MKEAPEYTQNFFRRLRKNKGAVLGLVVICISFLVAIFAYLITPDHTPYANRMTVEIGGAKPGQSMQFLRIKKEGHVAPQSFISRLWNGRNETFTIVPITSFTTKGDSVVVQKYIDEGLTERQSYTNKQLDEEPLEIRKFYLGTDVFGRDILSRLLIGTRVSLSVGLVAVVISVTIGILLGAIAGYFGGRADDIITWFINVIWSIPTLLLVFALTLILGKGFWQVFIAVGLTMWVSVARLVRGQVMALRELEFVEAAHALGYSHTRTIVRHILPNTLGPVMVIAASNFASAIVIEAGLSFLGVGVQPPQPSWGLMIKENYNFIITHNPMLALAPGIAIMILVLAFNLLGNGLRDALNVRGKL
jgi:ABC-type dipeptide/oligopeptide/nickel transport system permease subunit